MQSEAELKNSLCQHEREEEKKLIESQNSENAFSSVRCLIHAVFAVAIITSIFILFCKCKHKPCWLLCSELGFLLKRGKNQFFFFVYRVNRIFVCTSFYIFMKYEDSSQVEHTKRYFCSSDEFPESVSNFLYIVP